jgi:hypothetical protein
VLHKINEVENYFNGFKKGELKWKFMN